MGGGRRRWWCRRGAVRRACMCMCMCEFVARHPPACPPAWLPARLPGCRFDPSRHDEERLLDAPMCVIDCAAGLAPVQGLDPASFFNLYQQVGLGGREGGREEDEEEEARRRRLAARAMPCRGVRRRAERTELA